jgi:hypothetical protein
MPLVEVKFGLYACRDVPASWGHFWHYAHPCHDVGKLKKIGTHNILFSVGIRLLQMCDYMWDNYMALSENVAQ